jgi:hypothetical protein
VGNAPLFTIRLISIDIFIPVCTTCVQRTHALWMGFSRYFIKRVVAGAVLAKMYKINVNRMFIRRYTKGQRKKKAADAASFLRDLGSPMVDRVLGKTRDIRKRDPRAVTGDE